ncbi:MAG: YcfL family protein [Opitutales bacterium]
MVLILALGGCATVNTVEPAQSAAHPNMVNDKRVITSSSLNDIAYVRSVNQATVGGLLQIQVNVQNLTSAVKNFNYQVQWYDTQGMAITTPAPIWHSVSIEGGQTIPLTELAPTPNAVDWRLSLLPSVRS